MEEELFIKKIAEFEKPLQPGTRFDVSLQTTKFKLLFGLKALLKGQRTTHPDGVGTQGIAAVVSEPQFPACEFFVPGRSFPVCLRHFTIKSADDVLIDFCGAALRFARSEEDATESPFDLIMKTGPTTALWSIDAIGQAANVKSSDELKKYLLQSPDHLAANIDGMRHKPDSFYDQRYYTEAILDFKAFDDVKRYARFRLMPSDESPETGLLSEEEQREPWVTERSPTETLPKDYLEREYKERLNKGPLKYKLQLQLHEAKDDDPPLILHVGRQWNVESHPWLDLIDVTMTTLLSPTAIDRLEFNFANLPPSLDLLPVQSAHDPNVAGHVLQEVYNHNYKFHAPGRNRKPNLEKLEPDQVATYVILIAAGTPSETTFALPISISLTGNKGKTGLIALESYLTSSNAGNTHEYSVEAMDVGEIMMITFHKHGGNGWCQRKVDWFVKSIQVTSSTEKESFNFPFHGWLVSDMTVVQRGVFTPFEYQPDVIKAERIFEVQKNQCLYQWGSLEEFKDLPGFFDDSLLDKIPQERRIFEVVKDRVDWYKKETAKASCFPWSIFFNENVSMRSFDDHERIFVRLPAAVMPRISERERWMNDAVFGWQFLNGCNPFALKRCEELPGKFPVTADLVNRFLDPGKSLESEMKEGHVYLADYEELEGFSFNEDEEESRHTAQPLGLFYVNSSGNLLPIAIQLFQQPSDANPIWTPKDSKYDWLLAKMWLRHADYRLQEVNSLVLKTQMEVFAIAMRRQLPSVHPIFQLLSPHLSTVIAAKSVTLELSKTKEDYLNLLEKKHKASKFRMLSLPDHVKERGIDDGTKLPNFYFRDDARRLWEVTATFIQEFIPIYYKSDDDVAKDIEIQAWIQEIYEHGFPVREGDVDHECPRSLGTREQLIHMLTCVVFTCSCQHAAMTFGLMDVAGFVPFSPSLMRCPPPTNKNETTLNSIMEALPNKTQASRQTALMYFLSTFAKNERFLGDYSQTRLVKDDEKKAFTNFQTALHYIAESIKSRNLSLAIPYINLLPERTPTGISI